jgi:hypothetical protein
MTLSIEGLFVTLSIKTLCIQCIYAECLYAECCNLFIVMLSAIMLRVIMLSVVLLIVLSLSVVMLSVVKKNVVVLNVVVPNKQTTFIFIFRCSHERCRTWHFLEIQTKVVLNTNPCHVCPLAHRHLSNIDSVWL